MHNIFLLFLLFLTGSVQASNESPYIIFLNGTSSAGKSSIAFELQKLSPPSLHMGIDHFFMMLPSDYLFGGINDHEGFYLEKDAEKVVVKAGLIGRQMMHAMHRSMKVFADNQFPLIIDEVLFDEEAFQDYLEVFRGSKVYFISVKPPLEVAVQREKERGDRIQGMAKGLYDLVYRNKICDLEIDSSLQTPKESAKKIVEFIHQNPEPQAFYLN